MKIHEIAWAAGLIDGEGCLFIQRQRKQAGVRTRTDNFRLYLKVTMGCERTLIRLHSILQVGSVFEHEAISKKANTSFTYLASLDDASTVLHILYPYLVTKRDEAKLAIEFLELPLADRGGRLGSSITD